MKSKHRFDGKGSYPVRYFSEEERQQLLDTLEMLGFSVDSQRQRKRPFSPNDTNTYAVNIKDRYFDYMGEPFVCAAMVSSGVRFYSVKEFCRMAELGFRVYPRFLVFHVPHDGERMPEELMTSVCIPRDRFLTYHAQMQDRMVTQLIPRMYRMQFSTVRFEVSRLLCDVERFIGQEEVMEQYGMGFCYERVYDGTKIKNVTDELKNLTLRYYREHHGRMDRICESQPRTLIFDLHSYWDGIVPKEFLKAGEAAPDVCIGTDPVFTPSKLVSIVQNRLEEAGLSTTLNYPYTGCYVPNAAMNGKGNCVSIMLEFHRRTYLEDNGNLMRRHADLIRNALEQIVADCVTLGSER